MCEDPSERFSQVLQDRSVGVADLDPRGILGVPSDMTYFRESQTALRVDKTRKILRRDSPIASARVDSGLAWLVTRRPPLVERLNTPIEGLADFQLSHGQGEKAPEAIPSSATFLKMLNELMQNRRLSRLDPQMWRYFE